MPAASLFVANKQLLCLGRLWHFLSLAFLLVESI
jgi:hypothetical protein